MKDRNQKDWRALSEAVSREQDPDKLLDLVTQLNEALEERENNLHPRQAPQQNATGLFPATFVSSSSFVSA